MEYIELRNVLLEDLNMLQEHRVSYQAICDFVNSKQDEFVLYKDFFTRFRSKNNYYKGKSKQNKLEFIFKCIHEFRFMNQNREEHLKEKLIKLVENANKEEFFAYAHVNKMPAYKLNRLKTYYGSTHPAGMVVRKNLKHKKQYNWVLNVKDHGSDYRILGIELTSKFNNYAIIQTNEYWKLCWEDKKTKTLQFVYDSINRQTYLLARNKEGGWFIKDNIYISNPDKIRPLFINEEKLSELVVKNPKENFKILNELLRNNELGMAIAFVKRLIKKGPEVKKLNALSKEYFNELRRLNTNRITINKFNTINEKKKKQLISLWKKYSSRTKNLN